MIKILNAIITKVFSIVGIRVGRDSSQPTQGNQTIIFKIMTRNRCVITIRTNPPMFIMKTKHLEQIQDIKDNLTFLEAREAI